MPLPTPRLTPLAAVVLPLLLAGCDAAGLKLPGFGNRNPEAAAAPTHSGPPAVSPLEVPIETGQAATPLGTANGKTAGIAAFAAQGADWSAVVEGKALALTRPGAKPVRIAVRRIDFGGGVEFAGSLGGQPFALTVRADECAGGAPLSASVRYSGKTATGCAAPATAEQVATIAAAAAAPAPRKPAPAAAKPKPAPAKPAATAPAATTPPAEAPATPTATPEAPAATPAATPPAATPETPETPKTETAKPADEKPAPIVVPGGPTALPNTPVLPPLPPALNQ